MRLIAQSILKQAQQLAGKDDLGGLLDDNAAKPSFERLLLSHITANPVL